MGEVQGLFGQRIKILVQLIQPGPLVAFRDPMRLAIDAVEPLPCRDQ